MEQLTPNEANLVKDVLRIIGRNPKTESEYAREIGMTDLEFVEMSDSIFNKLGNGRVTFDVGGENKLI